MSNTQEVSLFGKAWLLLVTGVLTLASGGAWADPTPDADGNYTVKAGNPETWTQDYRFTNVAMHADLTLASGTLRVFSKGTPLVSGSTAGIFMPGGAGEDVVLTMEKGATLSDGDGSIWPAVNIGYMGAGLGKIVLNGASGPSLINVKVGTPQHETGFTDCLVMNGASFTMDKLSTSADRTRVQVKGARGTFNARQSSGSAFFEVWGADRELYLQGDEGTAIVFALTAGSKGKDRSFFNATAGGRVVTTGACDIVWTCTTVGRYLSLGGGSDRVTWAHQGKTVISNALTIVTTADNVLPCGPKTGIVEMRSSSTAYSPVLDLRGHVSAVNGLASYATGSVVSNGAATAATLKLGTWNEDGVLRGLTVQQGVKVVKEGTGVLSVADATIDELSVDGGSVTVTGKVEIAKLTLGDEDLVVRAGSMLKTGSVTQNGSGRIVHEGTVSPQAFYQLPETGDAVDFVKNGEGYLTAVLTGTQFDDLTVAAGTLRMGGEAVSASFWRFTFTQTDSSGDIRLTASGVTPAQYLRDVGFTIGRLHLFDALGQIVNLDSTFKAGYEPQDLSEGQMTAKGGWANCSGISNGQGGQMHSPGYMTRTLDDNWYTGVGYTNLVAVSPDVESSWRTFTFRLPAGAGPVFGYQMSGSQNTNLGKPTAWTVEASDDGVTWTRVDRRSDETGPAASRAYRNDGVPYTCAENAANWTFRPEGTVEVKFGATLDLGQIPTANIAVSALRVDLTAGAGAITKFVPAANGSVFLVNVPQTLLTPDGELAHRAILPLTLGEISSPEALSTWKVFVNGRETSSTVRVVNGQLVASGTNGLILLVK